MADDTQDAIPGRYLVLYVTQDMVVRQKVYEQASVREENGRVFILQDGREIASFRERDVESWEYIDDYPQG